MSKKSYKKPEIEITQVDRDISMVMMTDIDTPPDKPGPVQATTSSFEQNPFGTDE